jgi:hypothetical protein
MHTDFPTKKVSELWCFGVKGAMNKRNKLICTFFFLLFFFLPICCTATTYNEHSNQNKYDFRKLATVYLFEKGGLETVYHLGACGDFAVEIERRKDELSSLVEGSVLIAQHKLLPVNRLINKDHVGVRGVMDAQSAEIKQAYDESDARRAAQKAYRESDKGRATRKAYGKAYGKAYQ